MSGRRSRRALANAPSPSAAISTGGAAGFSGYAAANFSMDRGYLYWPTMDPRAENDGFTRYEIARRVHYLRANLGLARRLGEGITNLIIGTGLNPHAMTTDTDWNHLAEKAYKARARSGLAYSINGRSTGAQAQRLICKTRFYDGESAVVFAKSDSGGALRGFYSGIQIGNHSNPKLDQSQWTEGIRYDALDRATNYRFPSFTDNTFTDVEAANVRFLMRPDSPGSRRCVSPFAHAVGKMTDITELQGAVMKGLKTAQEIGYYITSSDDQKPQGMAAAMGGNTSQIKTPSGPVTLRHVFGQGGLIPSLPKGIDIKTLMDIRPHANLREFVEDFIRDISWGSGISSDLLWNIYKLGGANVRYVLADAQTFISSEQQDLVDNWLSQDWIWTIALEMKAGRLRTCQDPEWYMHGWIPPGRVTVDYGRDGRILLDWNKGGLLTTRRFYAMQGQIAKEEISDELGLIAWHKKEMARLGLTNDDLARWYAKATIRDTVDVPDGSTKKAPPSSGSDQDNEQDENDQTDDGEQSNDKESARLREMIRQELKEITV